MSRVIPIIRVLELIAEPQAVVLLLLKLEQFAKRIGAAMIEFFCSSSNLYGDSFHRAGYLSSPHPLTIEIPRLYHPPRPTSPAPVYFSYKLSDEATHVPLGSLYTKEGWYVTLGDSDLDRIQR